MRPYGVVKRFDIRENIGLRDRFCCVALVMHQLAFEAGEKVFSDGVVVGVSLMGHTLSDSQRMETFSIGLRGVLHAPVAVEDETLGGLFQVVCHV